ncbi:MAG: hypothetical protein V1899_08040 [Planctomycetota bacterium]
MMAFRCACEQVLGIEDQNIDKLGECQSCGRILRIPKASVSVEGRLKMKAAAPMAPVVVTVESAVAVAEPEDASIVLIAQEVPIEVAVEPVLVIKEATLEKQIVDNAVAEAVFAEETMAVEESPEEKEANEVSAEEGVALNRKLTKKERLRLKKKLRRARRAAAAAADGNVGSEVSVTEEAPVEAAIVTKGKEKSQVGRKVFSKGRVLTMRPARGVASATIGVRHSIVKEQSPANKGKGLIVAIVVILLLGGMTFGAYKADLFGKKSGTNEIKSGEEKKVDGKNEAPADTSKSPDTPKLDEVTKPDDATKPEGVPKPDEKMADAPKSDYISP